MSAYGGGQGISSPLGTPKVIFEINLNNDFEIVRAIKMLKGVFVKEKPIKKKVKNKKK